QIATSDPGCQSGGDVIEKTVDADASRGSASLTGIQPEEQYFITVQPIGPDDVTGTPSVGACSKEEFDTTGMRAPELTRPQDGGTFQYNSPHHGFGGLGPLDWAWDALDGPDRYRLTFYDLDEAGICGTTPLLTRNIDELCRPTFSFLHCPIGPVSDDLFPVPNPTGYCWDVVSISANGKESPPSGKQSFIYWMPTPRKTTPGVQAGEVEAELTQVVPPGHSYGEDVVLAWDSQPHVVEYLLKGGRWPWRVQRTGAEDPPNCILPHSTPCVNEPLEVTFRENVRGLSKTLSGDVAGKGRYCWTVWPIIEDPHNPGTVSARQPLVDGFPHYCYTTEPAEPVFTFDNKPADGSFTCDKI